MKESIARLLIGAFLVVQCSTQGIAHAVPAENPFASKRDRHGVASPEKRATFLRERAAISRGCSLAKRDGLVQAGVKRTGNLRGAASRIERVNGRPVTIVWDESGTMPIFMDGEQLQSRKPGTLSKGVAAELELQAISFLEEQQEILNIQNAATEFVKTEMVRDQLGMTHIRFQQYYQGIEVWGRDSWIHLSPAGNVVTFNGRLVPTPSSLQDLRTGLGEQSARQKTLQEFGRPGYVTASRRIIYVDQTEAPHSCWIVTLMGGLADRWDYIVDAVSGSILKKYNRVVSDGPTTGSGLDLANQVRTLNIYQQGTQYYLIDASKLMFNAAQSTFPGSGKGVIYTFDANHTDGTLYYVISGNPSSWSNKPAVSAAANGAKVYDYYNTVHHRNAIDGNGSTMNLVVNFNTNFNNAFWNGEYMVFGNGDNVDFSDLAGGLDVTAHEMTHGVVERTANLIYETQSGALNESFADVFGALCEFWVRNGAGNWLMGEDVTTPNISGDALRNMEDPGAANVAFNGQQPAHMNQYQNLPNTEQGDNGGVHINSGIPNKAFTVFAGSLGVTREEAEQVYYRALTLYLNRNSQFVDCRLAVVKAAEDLYGGAGNAKALAAAAAFEAVGITAGTGTSDPPVLPPVSGTPQLAVIDGSTGQLFRWTIGSQDYSPLSAGAVVARPSITDDGSMVFYVDQTQNLHLVKSDGTDDQVLSTSGGFNNISVSPNGRYLAVTTVFNEPIIHLFDLMDSTGYKQMVLYTPTYTEGTDAGNILFPDRLDWTSDSRTIMYDAYNISVSGYGDTTGYWDINLLRVDDGSISRLFPPQPQGISIGNAVFASNTDNIIAFDHCDASWNIHVLALNVNENQVGLVTTNGTSLGSPTFSIDDHTVYYHYIDPSQGIVQIWSVDLLQDGITGSGNDVVQIDGRYFPVSFAVGARATDVDERAGLAEAFRLEQNYPNPFNPLTTIAYTLQVAGVVKLDVYNALGEHVNTLVEGRQEAGSHAVTFDGHGLASGVYFYRLSAAGVVQTKKLVVLR